MFPVLELDQRVTVNTLEPNFWRDLAFKVISRVIRMLNGSDILTQATYPKDKTTKCPRMTLNDLKRPKFDLIASFHLTFFLKWSKFKKFIRTYTVDFKSLLMYTIVWNVYTGAIDVCSRRKMLVTVFVSGDRCWRGSNKIQDYQKFNVEKFKIEFFIYHQLCSDLSNFELSNIKLFLDLSIFSKIVLTYNPDYKSCNVSTSY